MTVQVNTSASSISSDSEAGAENFRITVLQIIRTIPSNENVGI